MRMTARRATKVVAWATIPRSATKQAPHFAATRMGRGFSGGLLCREARQWGLPLASPRFVHPLPKSRRRNRVGLVRRFHSCPKAEERFVPREVMEYDVVIVG